MMLESISLNEIISESDFVISSSSDDYFESIEESNSSLFNEEQTENETVIEELSSISEQTESTIEESASINEQTESTIEKSASEEEGLFSPSLKPDDEKDSSNIDQDGSQTMNSMFVDIANSIGENDNDITDRNGGGISKEILIGIIYRVAAAAVVAVVVTVFMRKKKMKRLNSKELQSSILEDTETKLQKDKSTTIKDEENSDLNIWL